MPIRVNPSEETIRIGPVTVRFLITGEQSGGTVAMFEAVIAAGTGVAAPPHSHDHYEETAYGIEGTTTLTIDGQRFDVGPGQAVCIPRGAVHRLENHGTHDSKALSVVTPAAIGPQFFREMAAVINVAGPPDRAKLVEIMRRHGLTPVPPPA
ncbi:MAG TPA: cupin domain-containing protein [Vicinamibacterales bacterium]